MPKGLTAATGMDALYDTPHGIANAIILPTVMEYNAEATGENIVKSQELWVSRVLTT